MYIFASNTLLPGPGTLVDVPAALGKHNCHNAPISAHRLLCVANADFIAIANSSTGGNGIRRPFGTFPGCRGSQGNALWLRLPANSISLTPGLLQSAPFPTKGLMPPSTLKSPGSRNHLVGKIGSPSTGLVHTQHVKVGGSKGPTSQKSAPASSSTPQHRHIAQLHQPPSRHADRYSSDTHSSEHLSNVLNASKMH
jgi:hypothetical protein